MTNTFLGVESRPSYRIFEVSAFIELSRQRVCCVYQYIAYKQMEQRVTVDKKNICKVINSV